MSDIFLKSNAALDRVVNEATNTEQMREGLKAELAKQGVIARDTDFGARVIAQPEPSPAPLSPDGRNREDHKYLRVIYPSGNSRIELTGLTEKELDEAEAKIRAAFGQR
jgi:hypothetical protein